MSYFQSFSSQSCMLKVVGIILDISTWITQNQVSDNAQNTCS